MRLKDGNGKLTHETKSWLGIGLLYIAPIFGIVYSLYNSWKRGGSKVGTMTPLLWIILGLMGVLILFVVLVPYLSN